MRPEGGWGRDDVEDCLKVMRKRLVRLYNLGYHSGHHDTVEGGYVHIYSVDMEDYHEEEVDELLEEFLDELFGPQSSGGDDQI